MPLSPHTVPGTHIVCTWQAKDLEDYAYHVILPQYRQRFIAICQTYGYHSPSFAVGDKFVLAGIEVAIGTKTGFMCSVHGGDGFGYALEHFDVAQLPKSITSLLHGCPVDKETAGVPNLYRW